MEISLNYEYRASDLETLPFEQLAIHTLTAEEMPENTQVSITFVDDDQMAEFNAEYRGKSGPTDVLSFECDGLDDDFIEVFDDPDLPFVLGDIIVAPDVAQRQSGDYGTTFEGEITLLIVHGLLHLCGYDHIEDDEAEEMKQRELEILTLWGNASGDSTAVDTLIFHDHPHHGRGEEE